MPQQNANTSPLFIARMGGACWLLCFLISAFAMAIGTKLIVFNDAAATASNLLANEALFRSSTAALLISGVFYVGATFFIYQVLKPVNRSISLLAALFSLIGCAIGALGCLFDVIPFLLLKKAEYLTVFSVEQLQALTLMFLKLRVQANNIGLVFFGLHCLGVGYLILRSTFLPRLIGALMVFAGVGWLTFLSPPLANSLAPYNMIPGGLGELTLTLWLLLRGVNVQRWEEQASADSADAPAR
jgi:Domain of unknown function (DUF4386)